MEDVYIKGALNDAAMIVAYAQGWELSAFAPPLWHVKSRVPTWFGAAVMAQKLGIKIIKVEIQSSIVHRTPKGASIMTESRIPHREYRALVTITDGLITGAGRSRNQEWGKEIAVGLAFRTALEKALQLGGER